MANTVYDPDQDELKKRQPADGFDEPIKNLTPEQLQGMEDAGYSGANEDSLGLGDKTESGEAAALQQMRGNVEPEPKNYFNPIGGKSKGLFSGTLKKRSRKMLLAGGAGGGVIIVAIILIVMFIGLLKSVHFATVLRSTGFAGFNYYNSKQFSRIAFDGAVLSEGSTGSISLERRTLLDRVRGINPKKQLKQLGRENTLKFNTEKVGSETFVKSVTINGTESETLDAVSKRLFAGRDYKQLSLRQRWTVETEFTAAIKDGLAERLALEGRSVRSSVYDGLRQAFGIKFGKWPNALKKFAGKTPKEAAIDNYEYTQQEIDGGGSSVRSAQDNVNDAADEEKNLLAESVKTGEPLDRATLRERARKFSRSNADTFKKVSAAVAVATMACIAHDINNSLQQIGRQNEERATKMGYDAQTVAGQIMSGNNVSSEWVGAESSRWDNAETSVFYQQDTGTLPTNADVLQAEDVPSVSAASIPGLATVDSILKTVVSLGTNKIAGYIPGFGDLYNGGVDKAVDGFCKGVLNPYGQGVIALAEATMAVVSAGEGEAILVAVKQALVLGATYGAGELAGSALDKYIHSIAGTDFSGASTGTDLYAQARVGTNLIAQTGNRQITYGRPLSKEEALQSQQIAMQDLKTKIGQESWTDRYFALSNPFSLTGRIVASVPSTQKSLSKSIPRMLFGSLTQIFKQFGASVSSLFAGNKVFAEAGTNIDSDHNFFGVKQWGWAESEYAKIAQDESFSIRSGNLDAYYEAHKSDTCGGTKTCYEQYEECYSFVKQSDMPDSCEKDNLLGTDLALHWRFYQASTYAADRLSEDINYGSKQAASTASTAGGSTYVLGDSLSEGMEKQGNLSDKLKSSGLAESVTVAAQCGRHLAISGVNCPELKDSSFPSGIEQAAKDKSIIAQANRIIIGLGTNDSGMNPNTYYDKAGQLIDSVRGFSPQAKIYWINLYSTATGSDKYPALNEKLKQLAQAKGIQIIDWAGSAQQYYQPGNIHPNGHYDDMADFVVTSLGGRQ